MSFPENQTPFHQLNPFVPGAGRQPPELVGRKNELEIMDGMIARVKLHMTNNAVVYSGLRGVGKTVLLRRLQKQAEDQSMLTMMVEAHRKSASQDAEMLSAAFTSAISSVRERKVRNLFVDAVHRVSNISIEVLGTKASAQFNQAEADHSEYFKLKELITEITATADKLNRGVFLFIDEFQEMSPEILEMLIERQHVLGQLEQPFYIIGAGLPNLPEVLTKAMSYAERLFDFRTIGSVGLADTRQGFCGPAEKIGGKFTADALDRLVELSGGYPYFIQAYGQATWACANGTPMTIQDVLRGKASAEKSLDDGLYLSRWQKATPAGREYMTAMASIATSPCRSNEVAKKLGKTLSSVSPVRNALIGSGLIYMPEYGMIDFTVPHMARFISRHGKELYQ